MRTPLAVAAAALAVCGALAPSAAADITFGPDPTVAEATGLTCGDGQPDPFNSGPVGGTEGSGSCLWKWQFINGTPGDPNNTMGPPPADSTAATVTSVKLPAMAAPGPMRIVNLTQTLIHTQGQSPGNQFQVACCQIAGFSQTFTPPADQVSTFPLDLPVFSQAYPSQPGQTSSNSVMAIENMDGSGTIPVVFTNNSDDQDQVLYPGPMQTTQQYVQFGGAQGWHMLAQFTEGPPHAATATPAPVAGPAVTGTLPTVRRSALGGLSLGSARPRASSRGGVTLGVVANPPTSKAVVSLIAKLPSGRKHKRKRVKVGSATLKVPAGKKRTLAVKLNAAGRGVLRRHSTLKVTETVVASGGGAVAGTRTRTLTIRRARSKR